MADIIYRRLELRDFDIGFLETLENLTTVDLTANEAKAIFAARERTGVITLVAEQDGGIVGTGSLIIEQKFIHRGGRIGHIEDVAVHKNHGGQGIGRRMIEELTELAWKDGCYKVILSCLDHNIPFYTKLGFRRHDNGMRIDRPECVTLVSEASAPVAAMGRPAYVAECA